MSVEKISHKWEPCITSVSQDLGPSQKRGRNIGSQWSGRARVKLCLLDMIGLLHSRSQIAIEAYIWPTPVQANPHSGMRSRGIHKSTALAGEQFPVVGFWGRRGHYFVSSGRWIMFHWMTLYLWVNGQHKLDSISYKTEITAGWESLEWWGWKYKKVLAASSVLFFLPTLDCFLITVPLRQVWMLHGKCILTCSIHMCSTQETTTSWLPPRTLGVHASSTLVIMRETSCHIQETWSFRAWASVWWIWKEGTVGRGWHP